MARRRFWKCGLLWKCSLRGDMRPYKMAPGKSLKCALETKRKIECLWPHKCEQSLACFLNISH